MGTGFPSAGLDGGCCGVVLSFFDFELFFPLEREVEGSPEGSMGKGALGSTFLITRNEAIKVWPPDCHSRMEYSGKR